MRAGQLFKNVFRGVVVVLYHQDHFPADQQVCDNVQNGLRFPCAGRALYHADLMFKGSRYRMELTDISTKGEDGGLLGWVIGGCPAGSRYTAIAVYRPAKVSFSYAFPEELPIIAFQLIDRRQLAEVV